MFLTQGGKAITSNTVKLVFSRLAKSSGVSRLHAHLCRHTFAINYLLNGGDIFSLREILGHTTLEMVNHYLHFTSSQITDQHRKYSPMDRLQGKDN
ncbi:tyrosine-type recombinase/integrase [Chloroflexota bacterium]